MSVRDKIRLAISTLTRGLQQLPVDKRPVMIGRVSKLLQKKDQLQTPQHYDNYLKELQFNINFLRLTFPLIDLSPKLQGQSTTPQCPPSDSETGPQASIELDNQEQLKRLLQQTIQQIKQTRQEVNFSNWVDGNLDPQDLKRHKQLLERQHFAGQFWKQRGGPPKSQVEDFLVDLMQKHPEKQQEKVEMADRQTPVFKTDPDDCWEVVKR